jgi:hypothetical protein
MIYEINLTELFVKICSLAVTCIDFKNNNIKPVFLNISFTLVYFFNLGISVGVGAGRAKDGSATLAN